MDVSEIIIYRKKHDWMELDTSARLMKRNLVASIFFMMPNNRLELNWNLMPKLLEKCVVFIRSFATFTSEWEEKKKYW